MEAMSSAGTQIARELKTFQATLRRVRQEAITAEIIELGTGAATAGQRGGGISAPIIIGPDTAKHSDAKKISTKRSTQYDTARSKTVSELEKTAPSRRSWKDTLCHHNPN